MVVVVFGFDGGSLRGAGKGSGLDLQFERAAETGDFGLLREPALPSREAAGHRMSGEAGVHGGGSGETSLRAARYSTSKIVAFSSNGPTGRPSAETRLPSG